MECHWELRGKCSGEGNEKSLGNAWKMLGGAWEILGDSLENASEMLSKCLGNALKS